MGIQILYCDKNMILNSQGHYLAVPKLKTQINKNG